MARKDGFVATKCLKFVIKYIIASFELVETRDKLKPLISDNFFEVIIRIMMVTDKDLEIFNAGTVEFVQELYEEPDTQYEFGFLQTDIRKLFTLITSYSSQKSKPGDDS